MPGPRDDRSFGGKKKGSGWTPLPWYLQEGLGKDQRRINNQRAAPISAAASSPSIGNDSVGTTAATCWAGVFVRVGVFDGVFVGVAVSVGVFVGVFVGVAVSVGVFVGVFVGVAVVDGVFVGVFVGVFDGVFVGVFDGVAVGVAVGVRVGVGVQAAISTAPVALPLTGD